MLTLNDGRSELWQWDTGRKLTVDADCSQVHFSNKVFGRSIDVDVIDGIAVIPDILLQTDKDLNVWAFVGTAENGYTKISKTLKVNLRNKPADYVFTPPEQTTLAELVDRLDKIEESQGPDAIKNAVDDYLANNPIKVEEKDPTVPEWAKQPTPPDVKIPDKLPNPHSITFTGAVNASYDGSDPVEITIPDSGGNVDLTGYATEQFVRDGYQPKGDYLESTALPTAINTALAQAKASGEFDGADGEDGADGQPGKDGADGAKGDKGDKGDTGAPGKDGANGKDGTSATHSWSGTVLTITSASGTSSADLKGAKGDKGDTGAAGKDGSDANVTAENIVNALGYTPANEDNLPEVVAEIIESQKTNLFSFENAQTNLAQLSKNKPTAGYINEQAQKWGYKDTENGYFVCTPSGYNVGIIGGLSLPLRSGNYKIQVELYIPITNEARRTKVYFGVFVAPSVYSNQVLYDLAEQGKWVKCEQVFTVSDGDTHVYPVCVSNGSSSVVANTFYARNIRITSLDPVQKGIKGKKWVAVGDSHTEQNSMATKRYYDYISEQTGIVVTVNGVGGSGYKAKEDASNAYYQRVLNLPTDTEVVTLFTSNNDVSTGAEIGTYSDTTTDTICGCLNKTIDNLFSVLPTVKLGVITNVPPQSYNPMSTAENDNEKLADAVAELCKRRGIPCLDLFHSSGLRPWDANFRSLCYKRDTSGGHFDEDGHAFIAPRIKALLESIIM